ncbi:MAG: NUDIX hydrolase [Candidatus Woesearchaeota archaeon]
MTIRQTVTNVIIYDNEILLGKQKAKPDKIHQFKEEWTIPCGTMQQESVEDCAVRELQEETGLTPYTISLIDAYLIEFEKNSQLYQTIATWVHISPKNKNAFANDDLVQLQWVPLSELSRYITPESKIYSLMSEKVKKYLNLQ